MWIDRGLSEVNESYTFLAYTSKPSLINKFEKRMLGKVCFNFSGLYDYFYVYQAFIWVKW